MSALSNGRSLYYSRMFAAERIVSILSVLCDIVSRAGNGGPVESLSLVVGGAWYTEVVRRLAPSSAHTVAMNSLKNLVLLSVSMYAAMRYGTSH